MSASSRCSIIKLDTAIVSLGNTDTPLYDAAQIGSSLNSLNNAFCRVATVADLPPVADNEGRFIYVEDIKSFRYSDGYYWTKDACSVLGDVNTTSSLWTWGLNSSGRLGDGTTVSRCSPGTVAGGGTNWCFVSKMRCALIALKTDGTLWTWGYNGCGRLGDGTTVNRCSPGTVAGGGTNWCKISAGSRFVSAIKCDGTLWTWGGGGEGALGDGTVTNRCSPGTVAGGDTTWCWVANSAGHYGYMSSAIKTDGTLWTWGNNFAGAAGNGGLGDGTTVNRSSPGTVAGGGTTWCTSFMSRFHGGAIKIDGTLWTWGDNNAGQLGDGTTVSRCSPGTTWGSYNTWKNITGDQSFTVALKTDGTLWTWGGGSTGTLGNNSTVSRCSPGTVAGGGTTWCGIYGGRTSVSAIKTDGTIWTWGSNNSNGNLGNGTTVDRCSPGTVAGGGTTWCFVNSVVALKSRGF